ncbi:hypothetical protein [Halomonas lysinitropha]|uniref:Chromosome segregation protein n=1 Tax=Halomonas lysinitropha TaxID=2607506 RepID=A0A5K1IB42_9GAMM|nr:hypothetical protein [Halomonas lysinitropha]VVZ96512.1 chromosome segregation protein [Halomonas lysinitropha]
MAQNQNDIQLRISAAVDGLQDIGKLLGELDEVGADTTAASADVEKLNEAMTSLSQQRKLIDALEQTRGKVSEAEQAMNEAVGEAERLKSAYDDSAEGVEAQRRAAQQAAEQAEVASQAYQEQRRELQALQTQYKGVQESTTGARQAWRDAAQRVQDLEQAIEASGGATEEQTRQLNEARGAADQARQSYEQQAGTLGNLRDELTQQRTAVNGAKESWEDYRDESRDLNKDLKESEKAFARQGKELDRAEQAADKASTSFQRQGKALDELSTDAKEAGVDVDNLADEQQRLDVESQQLEGSVDQLKNGLREYRQQVDQTDGSLKKFGKSLAGGAVSFAKWAAAGAAAGAALSVGLLTRYTAAQADAAQQIDNTSESIGVNAQRLQELQYAFSRVGIDADKTGDLLKDVADKIGDAYTNGGGEAKDAIDALGLSLDTLIGMSPDEQLLAIANALDSMPPASQVNIMESLANDASLLLPLLRDNAAGLRELTDEANQLGAIMSPEDIENLKATNEALDRLQGRLQGVRNRLIGEVSPAVNDLADSFDDLLEDNPGLIDDMAQVFRGLITTTQRWMEYVISNSEKVGSSLQTLIDTAQFLGNSFVAAFRGIQAAAAGVLTVIGGAVAGVMSAIEGVMMGLNRLGIVSDEAMQRMQARAQAARDTVADLGRQTLEYGSQAIQAGSDAVGAFDNSGKAAKRAAEETKKAAEVQKEVGATAVASAINIAKATADNAQRQKELREEVKATELELARYQTIMANDPSPEVAEKVRQYEMRLSALKVELQDVTRAADSNTKAMQAAAEAIGLTLDELRTGISDSAAEAIEGFETLARSGELTGEQLQDAFQATWENLDSPEAREAFLDNLREMVDDGVEGAGQWLAAWRAAFDGLEEGSDGAVDALKKVKDAAKEAADEQEENAEAGKKLSLSLAQIQGAANRAAGGVRAAWQALANQAREAAAAESRAADSSRDHASAVDEQTRAMQRAEQASSSLNQSLEANIASMQEQLAQLEGDQSRVQELQYDRQRLELQQQLTEAREAGDAEAQRSAREAMRLADEIHHKRLANIRKEAQERERQAVDQTREEQRRATATAATPSTAANQPAAPAQSTQRVEIAIKSDTGTATVYADSQSEADRFLEALGRDAKRVH